jgi:hypothetical protein
MVQCPNFADMYYPEQGIIILVGGSHKPSIGWHLCEV